MSVDLTLSLNIEEVVVHTKKLSKELEKRLDEAAKELSHQAFERIQGDVEQKLHSRKDIYKENLIFDEISPGVFEIKLNEPAMWIEEGQEPHSMLDSLLRSPKAKTSKDGHKYIVIPFKHNNKPSKQTPHQKELLGHIRNELKKRNIPYTKIEKNPDGSPRLGLLHNLNLIGPKRDRPKLGSEGPLGRPYSAHSLKFGSEQGPEGRPYLWGLRIYQRPKKNPDGSVGTSRDIFTFRTASSKNPSGWFHPGLAPMKFLDSAYEWAQREWDQKMAPKIFVDLQNL